MDLDQLLRETGTRWRQAQAPGPRLDVERLVTDHQLTTSRQWLTAMTAAAAAVLVVAATAFFIRLATAPTVSPVQPASPTATSSAITRGQLSGIWYHSVTRTVARTENRALAGDWVLTLDPGGSARLGRVDGTVNVSGRWILSAGRLTLTLPFAGCPAGASGYLPDRSTLHSGLLELVPGDEHCPARALVIGGHWFSFPSPG